MPEEESPLPPSMRNYKFVVVEVEEEIGDLDPGYYLTFLSDGSSWKYSPSPEKIVNSPHMFSQLATL
jgi:hypothetical protein